MGAAPSKPVPGTKMRVLALGLPRTGTSSLSAALEILLRAPSYHGGSHMAHGTLSHMQRWLACHRISYTARQQQRSTTPQEKVKIKEILAQQYEGYASVTDTPSFYYVEELVEMYPDALLVVTTRDVESWWNSKTEINALMRDYRWFKELVLFPIPAGIRYWPLLGRLLLGGAYGEHLGLPGREVYERHVEYLKRVVPRERLFWVEVKDGWEPLCRILGCEVPDVEFPRLNERKAFRRVLGEKMRLGVLCWAVLIGVGAIVGRLVVTWPRWRLRESS